MNQINLCFKILEIERAFLKRKGNMVIKVFQGSDFNRFYNEMKSDFRIVKAFKPKSSRKTSNEMYVIGIKKN